jgi:primosomal protein N' (replication factor Y)
MQSKSKKKLETAANALHSQLFAPNSQLIVLGPAEPFISKVQNNHRMILTLKAAHAADIKNAIKNALANPDFIKVAKGVEFRIDRDA